MTTVGRIEQLTANPNGLQPVSTFIPVSASVQLWICGQRTGVWSPRGTPWEFQGVFDSKDKAVAACRDETYFIMPATLNESLPHEPTACNEAYYPLAKYD